MTDITIDKKWVIFDTCTLSNISTIGNSIPIISSVTKKIGTFAPSITPLIRFEYLRKANSKDEFEKFREYLNKTYIEIDLSSLIDRFDIYRLSSEIACLYRYTVPGHSKNIELTNCINGGLLRRYPKNLFILTFDIKDFPEPLFKLLYHESIKVNKDLEVWGLYKFNKEGFNDLYGKFKNRKSLKGVQ